MPAAETGAHQPLLLSMMVAVADNGVIGHNNALPWRLSADLRRFKRLTMGKPLLMGRKTFVSLPGVLPGRPHLVMSRQPQQNLPENCYAVAGLAQAKQLVAEQWPTADELVLVGGAQLYQQFFEQVQRLYLTQVKAQPRGDAYLDLFDSPSWQQHWTELQRARVRADKSNQYDSIFRCLQRV